MNAIKISLVSTLALLLFVGSASAQQQMITTTQVNNGYCVDFPFNSMKGDRDDQMDGHVRALQNFLSAKGYFNYSVTGYFGPVTYRAVRAFQRDNGISATGYAGPLTRARMHMVACGTTTVPPVQSISINSMAPVAGPVGTVVTLNGSGFTADSVIRFGSGQISNVQHVSSQVIQFTVPDYIGMYCAPGMMCMMLAQMVSPGTYAVQVTSLNSTSNALTYTVTPGGSTVGNSTVSISGLDAPTTLSLYSSGTWTVHASSGVNNGNLQYSVVWGDENKYPINSMMSASNVQIQTFATFTHTYQQSGTYTPRFTVTDSSGASASTSATVLVRTM